MSTKRWLTKLNRLLHIWAHVTATESRTRRSSIPDWAVGGAKSSDYHLLMIVTATMKLEDHPAAPRKWAFQAALLHRYCQVLSSKTSRNQSHPTHQRSRRRKFTKVTHTRARRKINCILACLLSAQARARNKLLLPCPRKLCRSTTGRELRHRSSPCSKQP